MHNVRPQNTVLIENDIKTVTEYGFDENGRKCKTVRTYRIENRLVPKAIAQRKSWANFGAAKDDALAKTTFADDVYMKFIRDGDHDSHAKDGDSLEKLKSANRGIVKCRTCRGDHWTTMCPNRDAVLPVSQTPKDHQAPPANVYVPPARRQGSGVKPCTGDATDDGCAVRVTNLSLDAKEKDVNELFSAIGQTHRVFLQRNKRTGESLGSAKVIFKRREDAQKAVDQLNGHRYDHLILSVQLAGPKRNP